MYDWYPPSFLRSPLFVSFLQRVSFIFMSAICFSLYTLICSLSLNSIFFSVFSLSLSAFKSSYDFLIDSEMLSFTLFLQNSSLILYLLIHPLPPFCTCFLKPLLVFKFYFHGIYSLPQWFVFLLRIKQYFDCSSDSVSNLFFINSMWLLCVSLITLLSISFVSKLSSFGKCLSFSCIDFKCSSISSCLLSIHAVALDHVFSLRFSAIVWSQHPWPLPIAFALLQLVRRSWFVAFLWTSSPAQRPHLAHVSNGGFASTWETRLDSEPPTINESLRLTHRYRLSNGDVSFALQRCPSGCRASHTKAVVFVWLLLLYYSSSSSYYYFFYYYITR